MQPSIFFRKWVSRLAASSHLTKPSCVPSLCLWAFSLLSLIFPSAISHSTQTHPCRETPHDSQAVGCPFSCLLYGTVPHLLMNTLKKRGPWFIILCLQSQAWSLAWRLCLVNDCWIWLPAWARCQVFWDLCVWSRLFPPSAQGSFTGLSRGGSS